MQGVRFILQSDKSPDYLDSRIENFIGTLGEMFEKMSEEQFNNHKNGLSVIKLEEAKKVSKQADIYWVINFDENFSFKNY
jgi:insulysin